MLNQAAAAHPDKQLNLTVHFPNNGTSTTPVHDHDAFAMTMHAPAAFRQLWAQFEVSATDLATALCAEPLLEIANPGASGSEFYRSWDDQFFLKSVSAAELDFLLAMLPQYCETLVANKRTMLPKFFALVSFCHTEDGGRAAAVGADAGSGGPKSRRRSSFERFGIQQPPPQRRFIVMNNVLPSRFDYSFRFDLKGSTHGRFASAGELSKNHPTLKDLDFSNRLPAGLKLASVDHANLLRTLRRDTQWLEEQHVMDYSLLLGIHIPKVKDAQLVAAPSASVSGINGTVASSGASAANSCNDHQHTSDGTSSPRDKTPPLPLGSASLVGQRNWHLAKVRSTALVRLMHGKHAFRTLESQISDPTEEQLPGEHTHGGGLVVLLDRVDGAGCTAKVKAYVFGGIIDILIGYGVKKQLEHAWKSLVSRNRVIECLTPPRALNIRRLMFARVIT